MSYNPDSKPAKSGRFVDEDGNIKNIVDVLGGGTPLSDKVYDPDTFPAQSGRVIGEDGRLYNLLELLRNAGGGGGPVTWPVPGTPSVFPPAPHVHPEYTTEQQVSDLIAAHTDNQTIKMQSGELKAKALDGLSLSPQQINQLLLETIPQQISAILDQIASTGRPLKWLADVESHADMMSITTMQDSDFVIVLNDETRDNDRTWYAYRGDFGAWRYMGSLSLTNRFLSLLDTPAAYDDGKLLRSGTSGLYFDTPKWAEIDGRPDRTKAQIEQAIDKAHDHPNGDKIAKISETSGGVLTYSGVQYARVSDLPAPQTKQRLFAYRSGGDQNLAAGTDCVFNTKHSGDIHYDTSTGIFTLEAGKTYRVEVAGSLYTSGYVILQLVDAETNAIVNTIARGIWMDVNPSNTNWHEASSGPLKTYVTPTSTRGYKIRATSVSGESSLRASYMSLEIVEV